MEMLSSNTTAECMACSATISIDHCGIKCVQNHHICPDCTPRFVNTIFDDAEALIPVKCSVCTTEIPSLVFERQLTEDQLRLYLIQMALKKVGDSEKISHCSFCSYFEIWPKKNDMSFFFCKKSDCKKVSCSICYKEIVKPEEDYCDEEAKYEVLEGEDGMLSHFECTELAEDKFKWEKSLADGAKMFCPRCHIGGRKDDGCTHMTCLSCQEKWCYFCGKAEAECDQESRLDLDPIYRHNQNWNLNPKRCPMYFTGIVEADNRWPSDDKSCLDFFHKIRTLQLLRATFKELGDERYKMLAKKFPMIVECGYSLDDITNADLTLIKRGESDRI